MMSFGNFKKMAASRQESSSGGQGGSRTRSVVQRLQAMGCPYLSEMEEAVIREIIFTPGEARTRVLQWLVARFHPKLHDLLFVTDVSMSTIPRLTALLADMGLCSKEDYETIRGSTSLWKQLLFLEALLDLAEETGCGSLDDSVSFKSITSRADQCCYFLDALCRREDLSSVFPHSVSLLPPDIARSTDSEKSGGGRKDKRVVSVPGLGELRKELESIQAHLEEKTAELQQLMQTFSSSAGYKNHRCVMSILIAEREAYQYCYRNPSALESSLKTLSVDLGTLNQLAANFNHCYEAELQPWTNRQPPALGGLGHRCKRISGHLQHVNQLLRSLEQLERSLANLEQLPCERTSTVFDDICRSAQEVFQECTAIISQSLQ